MKSICISVRTNKVYGIRRINSVYYCRFTFIKLTDTFESRESNYLLLKKYTSAENEASRFIYDEFWLYEDVILISFYPEMNPCI